MSDELDPEGIDDEMKRCQWLCWGHDGKAPTDPTTGGYASHTDPATWGSWDDALAMAERKGYGVGFPFQQDAPFIGVDVDVPDSDGWVPDFGRIGGAVVERSPSGNWHVFLREVEVPEWWTDLSGDGPETDEIGTYADSKYTTVTGDILEGHGPPIEEVSQGAFEDWLKDAWVGWHEAHLEHDDYPDEVSTPPWEDSDSTLEGDFNEAGSSQGSGETDVDIGIYDVLPRSEHPGDERGSHPYHGSKSGTNFMVDEDGESFRCWRHEVTGHAGHLLGMDVGVLDCGEWDRREIATETWREIYDAAREAGYDIPAKDHTKGTNTDDQATDQATADGGTATAAGKAVAGAESEPNADGDGDDVFVSLFADVIEGRGLNPECIHEISIDRDTTRRFSVSDVVGPASAIGEAVMRYRRKSNEHDTADTRRAIAEVVARDLADHGRILSPRSESPHYFYEPEHRVYRFDDPRLYGLLADRYDIADDTEGQLVLTHLERRAVRGGECVEVYRVGYWDEEAATLCVHDRDGGYYAVTADGIEHRHNGANGVFFLPAEDADAIQYVAPEDRDEIADLKLPGELDGSDDSLDTYRRILVNRANVTHGGGLSPSDQRVLLDLYLHALPFMNRVPEKPILAFSGVKESGKTASMRAIGQFVNGTQWDVRMHADEEDFWAAVSNNAVVAYDQLDSQPPWLNDGLAAVATGTQYTKRKLYTTNEEATYRPKCWLAVNSRDPKFTRDDVASRLLILQFDQLSDKYGRRAFLAPLYDHYDELWSQYLDRLQGIVTALVDRNEDASSSAFRMADWADLVTSAADPLGYDPAGVDAIIDRLKDQQAAFALESEPAYQALQALLRDTGGGERYTAAELHDALQQAAENRGLPYDRGSGRSLSMWISHHRSELKTTIGLTVHDGGSSANEYQLPSTGQQSL